MPLKKMFVRDAGLGREEREKAFLKNGGLALEKLVAACNGRPIPIPTFSYEEIISATNNFDPQLVLHHDANYKCYKGSLKGRSVCVRSYDIVHGMSPNEDLAFTDLAISAKLSAHQNILRIVGCCLEVPILIYEYAQNGILANQIYIRRRQDTIMSWQSRLKIARQIAYSIAYMHTAFSGPVIHRSIKLESIFIDQLGVPKLTDFSLALIIPEGETHVVDAVRGTTNYCCPSYAFTGKVTEKTDIFLFGGFLLSLLTGKNTGDLRRLAHDDDVKLSEYLRNHTLNEIMDPLIQIEKERVCVLQQIEAVLQLAFQCTKQDPEIRPTMVEVTKELRQIERLIT